MKLRPHHIIDIISGHGKNVHYQAHPYRHSLHIVAPSLLSDLNRKITLVLEADDICTGCKHLMPDGKCNDVLSQISPSPPKQAYNDALDNRLFDLLSLSPGAILTTREFLKKVRDKTPGIEKICTHPKENMEERLQGIINGLVKLGI